MQFDDISFGDSTCRVSVWSGKTTAPTLICLSAMGVRASYYEPFAFNLNNRGFNIITSDWRGIGQSSIRPSRHIDFGFQELIEDVGSIIRFAEERFPETAKVIVGHSLGGQIASLYTAQYPHDIRALILIASCSVYHKGWRGLPKLRVLLAGNLFFPISWLVGYFPGRQIGFGGREARTVIRDWSHTIRTGLYQPKGMMFDLEYALSKLSMPRLAISFNGDQFAPEIAVQNLLNKFNPALPARHHLIDSQQSGVKALNHFNWVKQPEYFANLIEEWITEPDIFETMT